jgi:hypothetical protein
MINKLKVVAGTLLLLRRALELIIANLIHQLHTIELLAHKPYFLLGFERVVLAVFTEVLHCFVEDWGVEQAKEVALSLLGLGRVFWHWFQVELFFAAVVQQF